MEHGIVWFIIPGGRAAAMATAKRATAKKTTGAKPAARKASKPRPVAAPEARPAPPPARSRSADWVPVTPSATAIPPVAPAPMGWSSAPPPSIAPTRQVQGLRRALPPLLAAYVALQALNVLLTFLVPGWGSSTPLEPGYWAFTAFGFLSFAVYLPTIIVFCVWLHRTCWNAKDRHGLLDVSPGWAVGSFFIPFVQLVAPYFAIRKAYVADVSPDTKPLLAWFVPWSLLNAVGYLMAIATMVVVFAALGDADLRDPDGAEAFNADLRAATRTFTLWGGVPSLALSATAAWFLVRLVRSWSDLQEPPAS